MNREQNTEIEQLRKKLDVESRIKGEAMGRLETMKQEVQVMEGSDHSTLDIWKEKCRQLIDICRNFKEENERLTGQILGRGRDKEENKERESSQYGESGYKEKRGQKEQKEESKKEKESHSETMRHSVINNINYESTVVKQQSRNNMKGSGVSTL